ncbi:DUF4402 domain-containing protein [Christiangramia sp. SM2212]|uniref:DUF4402 domain-containing protein n=1 Tax=Christiangramia sediminicola TaxID=3073267 RepID=A0ABU1EPB1_9FLAO|nr:DUF4402 domain-containing protein [Christiangramia sp. SM2212]MDR5590217.1 DUF4402 domain-containing protein [Christiangramia sp. SM2212]
MKKITLLVTALMLSAIGFSQNTQTGTADVNAVLVSPITIEKGTNGLNFGSFTKSSVAGSVTVTPGGVRSFTQTDMEVSTGSTPTAADFTVTLEDGETYSVTTAVTQDPKNADDATLTLRDVITNLENETTGNTATSFTVGGTLDVPTTAAAATYTGEISVTVTYE